MNILSKLKELILKLKGKKEDKILLVLCIYSVFLLLAGTVTGSVLSSKKPLPSPSPTPVPSPAEQVKQKKSFIKDDKFERGNRWKLFSDSLRFRKESNRGAMYNVTCCYYEGDKQKIIIEADNVDLNLKDEVAVFTSRVRVISSKGETLEVDKFTLDNKKNEAYGEGNVKLVKEDTSIRSDKIQSDTSLKTYNLIGNVKVIKSKERRALYMQDLK
ncbi:MAG: LPS export ABC transporter periplasmic protein LptC [Candidatus Eremiobacterota bacterium]